MRRVSSMLLLTALLAAGCGLFKDATTVTVDTDWQELVLDADALGLSITGAQLPSIACGSADVCAQIACSSAKYQCGLQCGAKGTCEVVAAAQESIEIDISSRVKGKTQADALSEVEFDRLVLNTDENTLNFATPRVEIFVGPRSAKLSTDGGVVRFAELEPISPGETPNKELPADPAGQETLAGFVKDYTIPFRFLVAASLSFGAGQELPKGRLRMKLKAYFKVEPLD